MSINRRDFILRSSALMLALACENQNFEITPNGKSVLIIGAGISGLAAAKKLKEKGFEVTVVEASNRSGGRIKTNFSQNFPFDEGASWIHGPRGNPITDLAQKAGSKLYLTDDENVKVYDVDGKIYSEKVLTEAENKFEEVKNNISKNGAQGQSFESIFKTSYPDLYNNRLWKYMLSAYLEFDTGSDISDLSPRFFEDDEEFNGNDEIITNGYQTVIDYLTKTLEIRYNYPVDSINYETNRVKVYSGTQFLESDYVIVTVPLGFLKSNKISFLPKLSNLKLNSITNLGFGVVDKYLLIWKTPFWETNLQYIGFTPEKLGQFNYFLNCLKFSNTPALMTFTYGNYAKIAENMSDNAVIEQIMANLKSIYGLNIPFPDNFIRTKWGLNQFTLGAYSYVGINGNSSDYDELSKSVDNKVFFAGEHTSRDYRGTVHGAYLSGIREADKIIKLQ